MKLPSRLPVLQALGSIAVIIICYSWIVAPWMLRWGATDAETAEPGGWQSVRAVTINAPPEMVWPWLAQIGQTRAGFYSYTWIENLLGCQMVNAARVHPEWQTLSTGERVYLAPPGRFDGKAYMVVAELARGESLVLVTPEDWSASTDANRASGPVWSFLLRPMGGGRSRLIARTRAMPLEPAHFIMERAMLLGIKERAESTRPPLRAASVDWCPVRQRGLYGYADSAGSLRIQPRFVEAGAFENGVAIVATRVVAGLGGKYERRYGVIDGWGRFTIPPAFRFISHFREGLAIATLDGVTFGYIGLDGVWVLPPRFAEASDFQSGLAVVLPLGDLAFARVDSEGRFHSWAGGTAAAVIR